MRSDLDQFFCHNDGAIKESEIADYALTVLLNGERTAGINRDVIAEDNSARLLAEHFLKHLRALAIEPFSEFNVGRNWLRIPILLDMSIFLDVAHVGSFPDANSLA